MGGINLDFAQWITLVNSETGTIDTVFNTWSPCIDDKIIPDDPDAPAHQDDNLDKKKRACRPYPAWKIPGHGMCI